MMMLFRGKGIFLFPNSSQCPKNEVSRPIIGSPNFDFESACLWYAKMFCFDILCAQIVI